MAPEVKEKVSRTRKKKAAQALQKLGERLVSLSPDRLADMDLPPELVEAVQMAGEMKKHEARRRQMQYIGSLMRQCDGEVIETALNNISRQDDAEVRRFKQIEQWRDELAGGDDERLRWLLERYPEADAERLTRLVGDARSLSGRRGNQKAGRTLFRYLRGLVDGGR